MHRVRTWGAFVNGEEYARLRSNKRWALAKPLSDAMLASSTENIVALTPSRDPTNEYL